MRLARCAIAAIYAALLFSLGVVHAQSKSIHSITVYKTPT
jgi:hypothetical protein